MKVKLILGIVALLVLLPIFWLALQSMLAEAPENLGVADGRLAPCPDSPNCVSSEADDEEHAIAAFRFSGPAGEALDRLADAIEEMPRTRIVEQNENYLRAEFTTAVFRYVDDVEFLVAGEEEEIQVRSASRVGYSDLGANRKRVEAIRARFQAAAE